MPDLEYVRPKLPGGTPASLGELGLDNAGHLQIHNGTTVDTYTPGAGGTGGTTSYATMAKFGTD